MNSHTPSQADLEARLAKLERQNRRVKRLGLLFLLIAGSGFLLAQAPRKPASAAPASTTPAAAYDTLVVHRLELRDKAGKLRGVWETTDRGSRLALLDADGNTRAALGVLAEGAALALTDAARKPRAVLRVAADGPRLDLSDTDGKSRAALTADAIGPNLRFYSRAGELRANLSALDLGSALTLYGTAGIPRAALGDSSFDLLGKNDEVTAYLQVGPLGPSLQLQDAQQFKAVVGVTGLQTVATGESHTTSAAAVTLFGKDGKVIWRAP